MMQSQDRLYSPPNAGQLREMIPTCVHLLTHAEAKSAPPATLIFVAGCVGFITFILGDLLHVELRTQFSLLAAGLAAVVYVLVGGRCDVPDAEIDALKLKAIGEIRAVEKAYPRVLLALARQYTGEGCAEALERIQRDYPAMEKDPTQYARQVLYFRATDPHRRILLTRERK